MTSLYATIAPHFTQDLLTPELKVGYCDESGSWPFVAVSLSQRLPLRCIEWKNLVGATKFIDKLPVTFVAQNDLDALPLVCIYLVKCEDMELYKSNVKLRLSAWVDKMNAAKVEWMVLYVPLGTRAKGRSSNTSVYKKIFDKIRTDFAHRRSSSGTSGLLSGSGPGASSSAGLSGSSSGSSNTSERICKIEILEGNSVVGAAPGQHQQHESQWSELLLRLRHCIMDAFQAKCYQYEEEVRILDTKRNANTFGWDFGAFFLAKERLALMYQQTYLLDDAIRHLDELDAIFMNRKDEFDKEDDNKMAFTSTDSIFTTAPLALDLPKMQQQIAANRASASVIQLHCFCRQIRTLYLMGNFPQLIERATAFISSFFQTLTTLSERGTRKIARHLPYQWAVGACLEIAYACELSWNGHDYQVSSASVPSHATQAIAPEVMARHLGDLLYLARRTLKSFARSSGMSARYDSTTSRSSNTNLLDDALTAVDSSEATSTAWYEWLQRMFASSRLSEDFERCVWEMSHLASLHYSRAGRHRFAIFLGGECARYHFRHREFESASRLFRSHSRQCEEDKWWNLVGDCVRNICSSELELGRTAEAVAVCFSMLGITQDAKAEIGRAYLDKMMHTLVQSLDQNQDKKSNAGGASAKMKMGELITPSLTIETMQTTTGSDLDHGDVRITLCVSNRFPAEIHIETLHVRFCRISRPATARVASEYDDEKPRSQEMDASSGRNLDSSSKELPRLHSLVLEGDNPGEGESVTPNPTNADRALLHGQPLGSIGLTTAATNPNEASSDEPDSAPEQQRKPLIDAEMTDGTLPSSGGDGTLSLLEIPPADIVDNDGDDDDDEDILIFEESNVYLYEKASVHLVFLHGGLEVGQYVCTDIDCVLAGSSFNLMSASELEHVAFEIPRHESTLCIAIDGPPLLTPQTIEQICIMIDAHKDTVSDGGILEIFSSGGVFDGVKFLMAELQTKVSPSPTARKLDASSVEASEKLSLSIPPLALGERLTCRVWLIVNDVAPEEELVPFTTVSASLRYQHVTGVETNVAVRRAEAAFQILYPLAEQIRLKRMDSKVFAAISLTCNSEHSVYLRDYRLIFPDAEGNDGRTNVAALSILQDPNGRLRDTKLRQGETVHLAFTLNCPSSDAIGFPDEALLHLDLQYESGVCAIGDQASDSQQQAPFRSPTGWESTCVVRIPFDGIKGTRYRIDVQPRAGAKDNDEYNVGEQIVFSVVVREYGVTTSAQPDEEQDASNGNQVLLCLDERSERDWILVGKQQELFELQGPVERGSERQDRCFATQKRLVPTRVGRVRFPAFHLRQGGAEDRTPSERVLCPQSAKEVLVT